MKVLTISNQELSREALLRKAEEIPGAWVGIRIVSLSKIIDGKEGQNVQVK